MNCGKWSSGIAAVLMVVVAMGFGCREHFPHAFTWVSTGDVVPTHPKPPEGGYYSNWDPYACSIELQPMEALNPVGTQHVLIATVKDKDGKPLPNRRVEWMIADGGVGDIVEVDESGWRAARGYKQDNHFAVSHTNNYAHVLDRGNSDPADDIHLDVGQTWCTITSPVEGDTHIIAYAPGIYDWSKHKVFAKKHWYDVAWQFPEPATNPTGTQHTFKTQVMKYSDKSPLAGYQVIYKIVSGPEGRLSPGDGQTASVMTDNQGVATVTLTQVKPAEGVNELDIQIFRPEQAACCKPGVHIADGKTHKIWVAPKIGIKKSAPATAIVGQQFKYDIEVNSLSATPAQDVVVTDTLPDGIQYVSSQPQATVSGQSLTWKLGTMAGNSNSAIVVQVKGTKTGKFHNCAQVTAAQGLKAEACADTVITAPALQLEKQCSQKVLICEPIQYTLIVRNTGDAPATNVVLTDNLPDGLQTAQGKKTVTAEIGTLAAGQAKQVKFSAQASKPGEYNNVATVKADGGLTAEASCKTVVGQPALVITKKGPATRFIGRPVKYDISLKNSGNIDAVNTVVVDTLPPGAEFVEATAGGKYADGKVTWDFGTLAPNATKDMSVTVKFKTAGDARDTVVARATCVEVNADATTKIQGIPAILLEVIDIQDPIEVGGNETYVIVVTNQGSADDNNIVVTAILPDELEFVDGKGVTAGKLTGKTVNFEPLPSLAPKAKAEWRVTVKALKEGDVRFKVIMKSDMMTSPVEETESTHLY